MLRVSSKRGGMGLGERAGGACSTAGLCRGKRGQERDSPGTGGTTGRPSQYPAPPRGHQCLEGLCHYSITPLFNCRSCSEGALWRQDLGKAGWGNNNGTITMGHQPTMRHQQWARPNPGTKERGAVAGRRRAMGTGSEGGTGPGRRSGGAAPARGEAGGRGGRGGGRMRAAAAPGGG